MIVPVVVIAAVVVFVLAVASNSSDTPSKILRQSLPLMIRSFGPDARVAELTVDHDTAEYTVIVDGQLRRRSYVCTTHNCPGGLEQHVPDVRATPLERGSAILTLADISASVPDTLLSKLGLPVDDNSTLTLTRAHWTISSGARVGQRWQAVFNGTGLHQLPSTSP